MVNPRYVPYQCNGINLQKFRENGNSYLSSNDINNESINGDALSLVISGKEIYFPKLYGAYKSYNFFDQCTYPSGTYYIDYANFDSYSIDYSYYMPEYLKLPILSAASSFGDGQVGVGFQFLKTLEESLPPNFNGSELSIYIKGELQGSDMLNEILEKIRNKGWTVSENYTW